MDVDHRRHDTASAKFLQRPEAKQAALKLEVRRMVSHKAVKYGVVGESADGIYLERVAPPVKQGVWLFRDDFPRPVFYVMDDVSS